MASMPVDNVQARLKELCQRSLKLTVQQYTRFLSPPEAEQAVRIARENGLSCTLFGGYPSAERVMACFHMEGDMPAFPIRCIRITWDERYHQAEHRSLLGSVLGLGIERSVAGDIILEKGNAYLMAAQDMADFIAQNLCKAGRTPVQAMVMEDLPTVEQAAGKTFRDTVASLRLDAIIASGLNMSRTEAASCIQSGLVLVNHRPETRTDAQMHEGDLLSIRGHGRLLIKKVGTPNRKKRLPIEFESHGIH